METQWRMWKIWTLTRYLDFDECTPQATFQSSSHLCYKCFETAYPLPWEWPKHTVGYPVAILSANPMPRPDNQGCLLKRMIGRKRITSLLLEGKLSIQEPHAVCPISAKWIFVSVGLRTYLEVVSPESQDSQFPEYTGLMRWPSGAPGRNGNKSRWL